MNPISIGSVVRLTCGGPAMTVVDRRDDDEQTVDTVWFAESGELQEAAFPLLALRLVSA